MNEGDVNTQHIMMLIDKGIKLEIRRINTKKADRARKIYKMFLPLKTIAFLMLILMAFLEEPGWC